MTQAPLPSDKPSSSENGRKVRNRLSKSVAAQICVAIAALSLLAISFPGRMDSADAVQPELRHYVAKIASFLASNRKPQIVILGSSLMLYPATLCDLQMEGKRPVDLDWYAAIFMPTYSDAKYFHKLLLDQCNRSCEIVNLAVASSLMSDHCLLLEAVIAADKNPELLVCGIAPRDFLDNNQPDFRLTPVHTLLADIRPELFPSSNSHAPVSRLDRGVLQIKRAVSCLRIQANELFCQVTGRPPNDNASKMVAGELQFPPSKDKDLVVYKKVYTPVNEERFVEQKKYLERLLQDAKKLNIPVVLVSMPITPDNAHLLPPETLAKYNQTIKQAAADYHVQLLDLQQSNSYGPGDYIDSCHLNAGGGAKFYKQLVATICQSKLLSDTH